MNKLEQISNNKEGRIINKLRSKIQEKMKESHLPTEEKLGYKSTVGVYGGKINYDKNDKMIFDMRGIISKIDQKGDAILRTYDEHTMKNPPEMFRKHPHWFFRFIAPDTKRYRGTPQEIEENKNQLMTMVSPKIPEYQKI